MLSKVIPSYISITLLCLKRHIAELLLRAGLIRASLRYKYLRTTYEPWKFKYSDTIDGITFSCYTGLPHIYYGAWADERRRMGSYMAYRPRSCDRREYIAESGVYISTAREYIAESGVYIFNRKGVYCWVRGVYLAISHNCSTKKRKTFCFAMEWPIPPSPHYSL